MVNGEKILVKGDFMKAGKLTKETILDLNIADRGFPQFGVGDTIEVAVVVKEGNKERLQMFLGDVISMHNKGISSSFTIRKIGANNVGVERIFPYFSPIIDKIKVVKRGDIKRAKLYYLRDRVGKAARIKEKIQKKVRKKVVAKKTEEANNES